MRYLGGFLLSLAIVGCATPTPTPTTTLTPAPTSSPSPSATESPAPVVAAMCIRDNTYWPVPSVPPVDPCPFAIAATEVAFDGRVPITRIYLEPDVFRCNDYWPGFETPGTEMCMGGAPIEPGTAIHGWVAFVGSAKIAAIDLRRQGTTPSGPWRVSLLAFAEPPSGWDMP